VDLPVVKATAQREPTANALASPTATATHASAKHLISLILAPVLRLLNLDILK
jgi:hypothetical protein